MVKDADDPFEEFKDWLKERPEGEEWPQCWQTEKALTDDQKRIVAQNAGWLVNREEWIERVQSFEAALATLADEESRKITRALYEIRFDQHRFRNGEACFSKLSFPCSISFRKTTFGEDCVSFRRAVFDGGDVCFQAANFGKGDVSFRGAVFREGQVSFREAIFGGGSVFFRGVSFEKGHVSFNETRFGDGDVTFRGARFGEGNVFLCEATFGRGDVFFSWVRFGDGDVSFRKTCFGDGEVSFRYAKFGKGNLSFNSVRIGRGSMCFSGVWLPETAMSAADMTIAGSLYVDAVCERGANFQRVRVGQMSDLGESCFYETPDFRGAWFGYPPEVSSLKVPMPNLSWAWFGRHESHYTVARYRALRAMAEQTKDHKKVKEFFDYEMMAKHGVVSIAFTRFVFESFCRRLSDCELRFWRPFVWILLHCVIFAIFLYFVFQAISWSVG